MTINQLNSKANGQILEPPSQFADSDGSSISNNPISTFDLASILEIDSESPSVPISDDSSATSTANEHLEAVIPQDDTVHVVHGKSGGKQLSVGGHIFVRDGKPRKLKSGALVVYWYCNQKRAQGCKARLRTTEHYETEGRGSFLTPIPSHLHPTDLSKCQAAVVHTRLKQYAELPIPTADVVIEAQKGMTEITKKDIPLPHQMAKTVDTEGNRFLLQDTVTSRSGKRVLVFATDRSLEHLTDSPSFLDGTFQTAPQGFEQVFIVRVRIGRNGVYDHIPVAYCLLEDKKKESYYTALKALKDKIPSWNPSRISVDFETPMHNAVKELFPTTKLQGCLFHLFQAWRRHLCKIPGWASNGQLRTDIHVIFGLPFLPESEIIPAWNKIKSDLLLQHPSTQEFINYMDSTWMNTRYETALWSVFDSTVNGEDRTNNVSEGSNSAMKRFFGASKPTLWNWIKSSNNVGMHAKSIPTYYSP
eukprot:sb/3464342/